LFYVFGRYRYPLVPVLIPFAAVAIVEIGAAARRGEWGRLVRPLLAAIPLAVGSNWPIIPRGAHFAEAFHNAGSPYMANGQFDKAIGLFERALAIKPDLPDTLSSLAVSQASVNRTAEAKANFKKAIALRPEDGRLHMRLGMLLSGLGDVPQALAELRRAVELAPQDADSRRELNTVLAKAGDWQGAVENMREIVRLAPDDIDTRASLAWLLATRAEVRDGEEAVRMAEALVEQTGRKRPQPFDVLGAAYAAAGKFEKAIEAAQAAIALTGDQPSFAEFARDVRARVELYKVGKMAE